MGNDFDNAVADHAPALLLGFGQIDDHHQERTPIAEPRRSLVPESRRLLQGHVPILLERLDAERSLIPKGMINAPAQHRSHFDQVSNAGACIAIGPEGVHGSL